VSGVDRTEFQDGKAHNFSFSLDYLVTDDTAHTFGLESWNLRWNPTQLRLTSGIVQGSDRRDVVPSAVRRRGRRAVAHHRVDASVAKQQCDRAAPDDRQLSAMGDAIAARLPELRRHLVAASRRRR
jgi:hypothetical protein